MTRLPSPRSYAVPWAADNEALARILIAYRIEQGLTQKALAQRVGTSETAICRLESGQHKPSVETLVKIGRALGQKLVIGFEDASGRTDVATISSPVLDLAPER